MTQRHETDEYTDGIDMGVVWEEEPTSPGTLPPREEGTLGGTDQETDPGSEGDVRRSEGGTPTEGTIVPTDAADAAVTPKRALLDDVNEKLKTSLSAWHTYALLAWSRRWATAEAYVQDPSLYEEIVEEARAEIRRRRTSVAKKLNKAKVRKDAESVRVLQEELEELERKAPSAMAMDALTLKARGGRLAKQAALPAAVVLGPVAAGAMVGAWWALLAWPAAWVWLAIQGHAIAVAEGTVTVKEVSLPVPSAELGGSTPVVPVASPGGVPGTTVVGATEAENRLLARLAAWSEYATDRGLDGVSPTSYTLDSLGIRVVLTTTGKITPEALLKKEDKLRAALDVPAEVRTSIGPGDSGEAAVLRIRTRTPDLDTRWNPGRSGVGFVPDTGRVVDLDAYGHRLVAGVTGAGKSTAMRPWMASVVLNPLAALVYIDPKGQEAGLWEHCARTVKGVGAFGQAHMYAVISEVADELTWRQENAGGTDWEPTREHPEMVVNIDEGAALVRMSKTKEYKDVLTKIEYIASQGRAGKIWLHWATQYPTKTEGVPAQVVENITNRVSLNTGGSQADRVVFGDQATATGWTPSQLEMPGWSMVRTGPLDRPEHVANWYMDDGQVRALPARALWHAGGSVPEEAPVRGGLPAVLSAALLLSADAGGVKGETVAAAVDMDLLDAQKALKAAGAKAGRFTNAEGSQVRGYRREDLEEAAARYSV